MSNKLWNSFATNCLAKMYLQSELADIHFMFPSMESAPTDKVPAHKDLLASASPVFRAMFSGQWAENRTVEITDSNASAFKELLQFIYLPEVTLTIGNIEEVVRLADKYDMLECFETCAEFLEANLTSENMVWGYQLAITLNNQQLMEFCEKHIRIYIEKILRSEMFLHCSYDVIDHILKLDTLECNEVELFNACIEWAKTACQKNGLDENNSDDLKQQLGSCFYSIRFGAMEGEEIGKILQSKIIAGMFMRDELMDIMQLQWTNQTESKLFNHQPRVKPSYKWNYSNKLVCKRELGFGVTSHYIEQQESTFFSSNELVLLGEISFATIRQGYPDRGVSINFDIEIFEYRTDGFATHPPTKQIYQKRNHTNNSTFVLSPPIAIWPHKKYEIRLHPFSGVRDYKHEFIWKSEVELDDKIMIKFHQITSDAESGLVSELNFNRIE